MVGAPPLPPPRVRQGTRIDLRGDVHSEGLGGEPRQHVIGGREQGPVGRADDGVVRVQGPVDHVVALRLEPVAHEPDGGALQPEPGARDGQGGVAGEGAPHGHRPEVVATGDLQRAGRREHVVGSDGCGWGQTCH